MYELLHLLIPDFKLHPPQAIEDYLEGMKEYYEQLPYLTLNNVRSFNNLEEGYVQLPTHLKRRESEVANRKQPSEEPKCSGPVSIAQVMRDKEHAHVLILGEPGTGKSVLLRQLAMHAWTTPEAIGLNEPHLPILVSLGHFATAHGGLEERLNRVLLQERQVLKELPKGFFTDWSLLTESRWLILLDALDEVPEDARQAILEYIRLMLRELKENRIVITSRTPADILSDLDKKVFGQYELLPFTPEQSNEFAREWFGDQAEAFLQELERVRVSALSETPLLLTISAKVYREKHALPKRRSALYAQFVDIWLKEAEARRLEDELGKRVTKVVRFGLARLARAMTEQAGRVSEGELVQVAAGYLSEALHLSEDEAEIDGKKFVNVVARRSGIFLRRGDVYDWIHTTFREYLAADAIVRECKQDLECVWKRAVARWTDATWREVSLFALSLLSDAERDMTVLVERILLAGDEGLYFAGRTLAEQVKVTDTASSLIIDRLLDYARRSRPLRRATDQSPKADRNVEYHVWRYCDAPRIADILAQLCGYSQAAEGLLALTHDNRVRSEMRMAVAERLAYWGHVDEAARIYRTLARDLRFDPGGIEAALELGKLGHGPELLALARDEQAGDNERGIGAFDLGKLGPSPDLLALGQDKRMPSLVRQNVALALANLGHLDDAVGILFAVAKDEEVNAEDRLSAVKKLRRNFGRLDETYPIMVALARDGRTRQGWPEMIVDALGRFERGDDLRALAHDEVVDAKVRVRAAEWLVQLGHKDEASQVLWDLVVDERVDAEVQRMAVRNFDVAGTLLNLEQRAREHVDKKVRQELERMVEKIRRLVGSGGEGGS